MKKYFSKKFTKINCLNNLSTTLNNDLDNEKSNKLIVFNANGIYIGNLRRPVDPDNYEVTDQDDFVTIFHKSYLETLDDIEKGNDNVECIVENHISITLENVELRSNNIITTLPFVEIFIDQIIGISFGSISSDNQQN